VAIDVRTLEEGDVAGWVECMNIGFLSRAHDGEAAYRRGGMDLSRTWGALDDGRVVATLRSFATTLTTPGPAAITAAALTNVTVSPTHRRRGLLRRMITGDLKASAERGEAIGILIASEYPIYGRFGYGAACEGASYTMDASQARFVGPGSGSVELVDEVLLRKDAPAIYEQVRSVQPGFIDRTDRWWDRALHQVEVPGAEAWKGYQALYRSPEGTPEGYLRYRAKPDWDLLRANGTVSIDELTAATPRAYRRLWQYCCDIDLVATVEAGDRSVDEALPWLLEDGRAVRQTGRFDFVWTRILDVGAALTRRRYAIEGRLVLEVVDPLGLAGGRVVLDGGPGGATCAPTDQTAGLTMPVDALGSAFLGGVPIGILAAAGRVDAHDPAALAMADAMFRPAVTPWCSTWF
jgi:predicted acetyltransferase